MLTTIQSSPVIKDNFKFSDLFKDFNCTNVDEFVFDGVTLKISEDASASGLKNKISFKGKLTMEGTLSIFKDYLNSDDYIEITGTIISSCKDLTQKITPQNATFKSVLQFHKEIFQGVTLTQAWIQLDLTKKDKNWVIVPKIAGDFDINDLTDKDEGKLTAELTEENKTLILNATAKNLKGAFGIQELFLENVTVNGKIGETKSLNIASQFVVGNTTFDFGGVVTPEATGVIAKVDDFNLDELNNIFIKIAPGGLTLPEFTIDFKNTSIALATADCKIDTTDVKMGLTVMTNATAHGHTFDTQAEISCMGVVFYGALGNLTLGPVKINKTALDFQIYKKSTQKPAKFEISGEAVIEGVTVDCGIYFEKYTDWTTVLYADLVANSFKMSHVFPETQGSFVDELSFSKVGFIYASASCVTKNEGLNYSVQEGLQLMGVLEEIPGLSSLTGEKHVGLILTAHFGAATNIGIEIPDTRLHLGHSVECDPFKIQINITPQPSLMLVFGIEVDVPKQTTPLHFDMALSVGAIEAKGSVTMKNYWVNPFGIHGVKIGPALALQIGIIYEQFVATGIPSEFGIAGGLEIADTVIDMAVSISENPMEEILMGKLEELNPSQLIEFAANLTHINIPDVPDFFELKELELYCAPAGGSIGTITYKPGFSFSGDLVIAGKKIAMYTRVSDTGIEGVGHIDNLNFGPLKIGGEKGKDASVDLVLTTSKQSLLIDGSISFLGAKEGVYVDISNQGIAFTFEQNFFGALTYKIEGESIGTITKPETLDFKLSGEMDNNISAYLKNEVAARLDTALKNAEAGIDKAEADVDKTQKAYDAKFVPAQKALTKAQKDADVYLKKLTDNLNKEREKYVKDLEKAQKDVKKAKGTYDNALKKAQNDVTTAQKEYNAGMKKAQSDLDVAQREYNNGIKTAQKAVNDAERKYNNSIGAAQRAVDSASRKCNKLKKHHYNYGTTLAAYGIAKGVLAAAKKFLDGAKYGVDYTAFQSARAALQTAKTGVNYTAFESAKAAVQAAKTGVNYTAFEAAKKTLESVRYGSDYTVWQGALKSLSAVKVSGEQAITQASNAINTIGRSAAYLAFEAAKKELEIIQKSTEAVAFESAKAILEGAKLGAKGVLKLSEYIAKHAGDIIDIKKIKISGSLKEIEKGNLFDAQLDVALLGKDYHWNIDFNVKDVVKFIEALFNKALDELKTLPV
ncbi:hypothetical protein U6A24_08435 [Aquimarina gracilis]|uniref:Uncharacterized protein n=1 Tax=Aquimarina gracilis TaxID=874422 RepID=A0ABU5ZV66_9FLAO|nr:hypothetical protein [Aquimarina gracilis]MEB3345482.1 hypothetical protein [Aquimarina gracilis]